MRGKNSASLPQLSVTSDTGEELSQSLISPLAPALTPTFRSQNLSPFWLSSVTPLAQLTGYTSDSPCQPANSQAAALSMLHAAAITGDTEGLEKLASGKFCDISLRDKFGRTPLMYGVLGNYPECVEVLVREGAEINLTDSSGRTALHWAAHHGYGACAKILVRATSSWDIGDQAGVTVLHLAMRHDKTVLQLLTKKYNVKEKINILDINKRSPLHWACALGNYDQAKMISKLGADIGLIDVEGKTALHWAVTSRSANPARLVNLLVNMKTPSKTSVTSWQDYEGRQALHLAVLAANLDMVRAVVGERSCMINSLDHRGRTALHWAAVRGDKELVRALLEAAANTDLRDEAGATPAHLAVQSASLHTVQMFTSRGHHVLLDSQRRTPLMWAVAGGRQELVELFTEADLNTLDKFGCSAVHIAVQNNLPASLKSLISLGADLDLTNMAGETGLMVAARMDSQEVAELLVTAGAHHTEEALLLAAAHGHRAMVKILLRSGANVNYEDSSGRSPLMMASYGGHDDVVVLLLESSANIDHQDKEGMCSLHWAVRRGQAPVVRTLLARGAFANNIGRQMTPLDSAITLELTEVISLLATHKVSRQAASCFNVCCRPSPSPGFTTLQPREFRHFTGDTRSGTPTPQR